MEYSMKGGVSMSWDGKLKAGAALDNGCLRLITEYTKTGFTFTAEADIKAGLKLSASVDAGFANGSIWASIGVKMNAVIKGYDSGTPKTCVTIKGYLYAQIGASMNFVGIKELSDTIDIFTESNSPVRVVYHYEDNSLVGACTRGQSLSYTTSTGSRYFNPSPSYGQGSYGGGSSSDGATEAPVVIWVYEVEDGNATIKSYNGHSSAVAVPGKIDGYTVTGIGEGAFKNNKTLQSVTIPDSVTSLGKNAFSGCTALTVVDLPEGLTSISYGLFNNCTALETIDLPDSITSIGSDAFCGCTSLIDVKLPSYLEGIAAEAFYGCSAIRQIKLPDTLVTMEPGVFKNCSSLTSVNIPKTLTDTDYWYNNYLYSKIYSGIFEGTALTDVTIDDGVTLIPEGLFYNCTSLKSIELPDTVTEISDNAFEGCTGLTEIKLPYGITTINDKAFMNCTSLESISLPDSVSSMGTNVFYRCEALKSVRLPVIWQNITEGTFGYCTSLESITLPDSVTAIRNSAFYGCTSLKSIELSNNLQIVEYNAFYDCTALESIALPESCTELGGSVFYGCTSLNEVELNYGLTEIGSSAFYGCDGLEAVTIPDSVTTIGSSAFYGCDKLADISFGIGVKSIGNSAFKQCKELKSIVLPRYCTKIDENAFAEDTKLTDITVLPGTTAIANSSFSYPGKITIYGVANSYANTYADSRDIKFQAINKAVTRLSFYKDELELSGKGKTKVLPLNVTPSDATADIVYSSSDENIATVENGVVTATGYGRAVITAKSGSSSDTIEISILKSARSISLDKTELDLSVGDTAVLTAEMSPSDATDRITWSTSNAKVAAVKDGTISACGIGSAIITATTTSGKSASCNVTVIGNISVTANAGEHGRITPSGTTQVKSNEKLSFRIVPDYGYVVKDVIVNGNSVGARESYELRGMTTDTVISAEFEAINVTYENGSVTLKSAAALNGLKLIAAEYNDDGTLKSCSINDVWAAANEQVTVEIKDPANKVLMLWSRADGMRPIWKSE